MKTELGKRISVVGTTGSGKTTVAKKIAGKLGYAHIELDALWWDPNWTNPTLEVFRQRVTLAASADTWVVDGNYSRIRDIVWTRAATIIWLDYPLWLILLQLFKRTTNRIMKQEQLWNGNRERFTTAFLSRESLFLWALQTYKKRKHQYPQLLSQPEYVHLQCIQLTSPRKTQTLLNSMS